MKPTITEAIILARINYQEADRILTVLTPEYGKIRLMAKGARKVRSKLAGGVELFSISELGFIRGRGEVGTLISSRLIKHYGKIVNDIDRTMYGYEILKILNKITEDNVEAAYFELAQKALAGLEDNETPLELVKLWVNMQILNTSGHLPNLIKEIDGAKLDTESTYDFDMSAMGFTSHANGPYKSGHIKLLRLVIGNPLVKVKKVKGIEQYIEPSQQLALTMRKSVLHV